MEKIKTRIKREILVFQQLNQASKLLLLCASLFWLASPFVGLFLNIYLWKEARSLQTVALFNLFTFSCLPIGFIINGFFLKRITSKTAFQLSFLLQSLFPITLIILKERVLSLVIPLGITNGLFASFYWANFNQLTYDLTTDKIRGYFTGIGTMFSSLVSIIAPPLAGFVIGVLGPEWLQLSLKNAYFLAFFIGTLVFLLAAIVAGEITSSEERQEFSFNNLSIKKMSGKWTYIRVLNLATGFYGGIFAFSLGLLSFKFFGREIDVGWFSGFWAAVGAFAAYFAGRYTHPQRRFSATVIGVAFFFLGSIFLGTNFSLLGFFIFVVLMTIGDTFLWMVHHPIQMKEMERGYLSKNQRYHYWVDIEIFINLGRALGITSFIFLSNLFDFELLYRLIIIFIGFVPFISLKAIRNLVEA